MEEKFYFLDYRREKINNNDFLHIYILNLDKHLVFSIYKKYTDDLLNTLDKFYNFDDISNYINFVIKRDGKISLDINFQ